MHFFFEHGGTIRKQLEFRLSPCCEYLHQMPTVYEGTSAVAKRLARGVNLAMLSVRFLRDWQIEAPSVVLKLWVWRHLVSS